MTTRELINHLEDLIREGKITGATEAFVIIFQDDGNYGEESVYSKINKEDIEVITTEKLDGKNTKLTIDARWLNS